MPIIAGMDEAGYGPLLGPLVVSAVVFERPSPLPQPYFLPPSAPLDVTVRRPLRKGMADESTVAVCDSKQVYCRRQGIAELERSVLSFLGLVTSRKGFYAWQELLEELSPGHVARLSAFPWYREADFVLPVGTTPAAVRSGLAALQATDHGRSFRGAQCEVVEAREFNEMVAAGLNKADLLFHVSGRLLLYLWKRYAIGQRESGKRESEESERRRRRSGETWERGDSAMGVHESSARRGGGERETQARTDVATRRDKDARNRRMREVNSRISQALPCLYCTADGMCHRVGTVPAVCSPHVVVHAGKHGGKTFYAANLRAIFPTCEITAIRESPAESVYCICAANDAPNGAAHRTAMVVCFLRDGEDRSYELALASLFAKYTRELHMIAFNDYWAKRLPHAFHTTGYHCDANRFLELAMPELGKLSIPLEILVRVR